MDGRTSDSRKNLLECAVEDENGLLGYIRNLGMSIKEAKIEIALQKRKNQAIRNVNRTPRN